MAKSATPPTTTRAAGVVSEFFSGFATLFRGFSWWKRRPGLMLLGLVPALIVAVALIALILVIAANAEGIVGFVTPVREHLGSRLARLFRVIVAISLLIGFVVLAAFTFTGLTLLIGDWFYERIWRAVETELGGMPRGAQDRILARGRRRAAALHACDRDGGAARAAQLHPGGGHDPRGRARA